MHRRAGLRLRGLPPRRRLTWTGGAVPIPTSPAAVDVRPSGRLHVSDGPTSTFDIAVAVKNPSILGQQREARRSVPEDRALAVVERTVPFPPRAGPDQLQARSTGSSVPSSDTNAGRTTTAALRTSSIAGRPEGDGDVDAVRGDADHARHEVIVERHRYAPARPERPVRVFGSQSLDHGGQSRITRRRHHPATANRDREPLPVLDVVARYSAVSRSARR